MFKIILSLFTIKDSMLGRKIAMLTILFSSCVTIFSTTIQLLNDYNHDVNNIYNSIDQIIMTNKESIARAVWDVNPGQIKLQIEGLLNLQDIQYLEVNSGGEIIALAGKKETDKIITKTEPLKLTVFGEEKNVGNFTVDASLRGVYKRIIDKLIVILITNGLKTFMVSVFILFLCNSLVFRHVNRIGEYSEKFDKVKLDTPLSIERKIKPKKDELDFLVSSINQMRISLKDSINEVRDLNQNLEKRVEERTLELEVANEQIRKLNKELKADNKRMEAELEISHRIQQLLLPHKSELDAVKYAEISSTMIPAEEVGGDYYDIINCFGKSFIGIGDVTDHGFESGIVMLVIQTVILANLLRGEENLQDILVNTNQVMMWCTRRIDAQKAMTLSLMQYQKGKIIYSGQHETILVVRKSGVVESVDTMDFGILIGITDDIEDTLACGSIQLEEGEGLVLYTDGITEAEDSSGEFYGLSRFSDAISRHWDNNTPEIIKNKLLEDVYLHLGENKPQDDITLLVLKKKNGYMEVESECHQDE